MQGESRPVDGAAGDAETPGVVVCGSCQRTLPGDALYCPHCCGEDGRRGQTTAGMFLGAVIGVLAGGLVTAAWSSAVGAENMRWRDALATLGVCVVIGVVVGILRTRKG